MSETLNYKDQVEFLEKEKRIEAHSEQQQTVVETAAEHHEAATINPEAALTQAKEAEPDSAQELLEQINNAQEDQPPATFSATINAQSRKLMQKRGLKNIQQKESLGQRNLSRIIHQPVVRAVSEGAGKTVSRPSGLLGGGLLAFLGSGTYFALAKTLHFEYRYSVSLVLFGSGFLIGLFLELLAHVLKAKQQRI